MIPVYPVEILPKTAFVSKMDTDELLAKYPGLMVVRQVEGNIEACRMV